MTESPAKLALDRQQLEAFRRINGFTDQQVAELRRYCTGRAMRTPPEQTA